MLCCIVFYCIDFYFIVLYCLVLYCLVLYFIVLHNIDGTCTHSKVPESMSLYNRVVGPVMRKEVLHEVLAIQTDIKALKGWVGWDGCIGIGGMGAMG